ncbi:MAG: carbohydrate ABC transporter permease [Chloroflexota bacterium]
MTVQATRRVAAAPDAPVIRRRLPVGRGVLYAAVIGLALMFMFPFLWTVLSSLKPALELMAWPPTILPRTLQWQNYPAVFDQGPFGRFIVNTFVITGLATLGQVFSSLIVAYGFSRMRFPGRGFLFGLCLSTMILPAQVTIVPLFLLFRQLRWIDTYLPLIVPYYTGTAFSIFLFRQFILTLPYDLDEAAIIDGASRMGILWRIILPNSGSVVAAVTIFGFMGHWNAFLEPFIFLNTPAKFPLGVGLRYLSSVIQAPGLPKDNLLMAGSVMMTTPIIILFFLAQEYLVQGIATTGLKG